jgi:hypothetical protein
MPIDSTADLLFRIGADAGDGTSEIQAFRALLGKDLEDLSAEFGTWANKVFGDLSTVQGVMTAAAAGIAAGVLAAGAAIEHFAGEHAHYVEEVERGSRATGISTENMSALKFMAQETGTSYDSLVTGLTRFASTIVKAAGGSHAQEQAFAKLGITQEQVKAGEKDMMPLLELVADRFKGLGSQVDRTAIARDLFSRGGSALVKMLSLGSAGIKDFEKEAEKLGLTIHTEDVVAMEEFRATTKATHAQMEALSNEIGKIALPIWENFQKGVLMVTVALKDLQHALRGDFWATFKKDGEEIGAQMEALAHALANLPAAGDPLDGVATKVPKIKEDFREVSQVLGEVQTKMADLGGAEAKAADEGQRLRESLTRAVEKLFEMKKAGTISAADFAREFADFKTVSEMLPVVIEMMTKKAGDAVITAVAETHARLTAELMKQGPQTLAIKQAEWAAEIEARRAKIVEQGQRDKTDETANLELLDQVYQAGARKISDDALRELLKGNADLAAKVAAQGESTRAAKVAAIEREVADMTAAYKKEGNLTAANEALIAQYKRDGLAKIAAEEKAAYTSEMARLGEQLERINREHQTSEQRIGAEYAADAAKFSATEEKKTLALATNVWQRIAIMGQFAAVQAALTQKEQQDLQQLQNSQGWKGVFGSEFAQMIRGNEALSKEWAASQTRAQLMVKVALESMKEEAQHAFQQMAQGMGGAIAQGLVYEKSIGKAMEAALKSTLASLAAQAFAHAIYSMGLGFLCLAEWDEPGAVAAFEAAALFGSLGAVAGLAGRAIPGGGSGGSGGAGSGGNGASAGGGGTQGDSSMGNYGTAAGSGGSQHVTVNVYGHVVGTSGVSELTNMINDAVLNQGATLTATNTTTGKQVQQ